MDEILSSAVAAARPLTSRGRCADYIPALAGTDPSLVGLALVDREGRAWTAGDARARFSLQSVSKAIALALVIEERGEEAVFSRVGREPTGDPFNSIIRLESSRLGKPYNPLINAGAIVVSSLLPGRAPAERVDALRAFMSRALRGSGAPGWEYAPAVDEAVYESERATGFRNRSIAWFLKELGILEGEVDEALDSYFLQCSISVDALALAAFGAVLAFDGELPRGGRLVSRRTARIVKSLMMSCGLYDGSGDFGVEAGLPAKSGVGGGIMACAKGRYGIGTFGPALDDRGNSVAGVAMIAALSERLELFAL